MVVTGYNTQKLPLNNFELWSFLWMEIKNILLLFTK